MPAAPPDGASPETMDDWLSQTAGPGGESVADWLSDGAPAEAPPPEDDGAEIRTRTGAGKSPAPKNKKKLILIGVAAVVAVGGVLGVMSLFGGEDKPRKKRGGKRPPKATGPEKPRTGATTAPAGSATDAPDETVEPGTQASAAPSSKRPLTEIPVDSYQGYAWATRELSRLGSAGDEADLHGALAALARALQAVRYGKGDWMRDAKTRLEGLADTALPEAKLVPIALAVASGKLEDAQVAAAEFLGENKGHPEALFLQGEALRLRAEGSKEPKDRRTKAEGLLLKAASKRRSFQRALFSLAILHIVQERPEEAIDELRKVLDVEPLHPGAAIELARLLLAKRDYAEAATTLEAQTDEKVENAPGRLRSKAHHLKALILFRQNKGEDALAQLTLALKYDSGNIDAHLALAQYYDRRRQYPQALSQYENLSSIGKDDAETLIGIIKAQVGMAKLKEAEANIEKGAKRFKEDARFPYYAGQLHERRYRKAEAKRSYEAAQALDPKFLRPTVRLAKLLAAEGKWTAAQTKIESVLFDNPDSPVLRNGLGEVLFGQGDPARAEAEFRKAIELDPDLYDARFNLARVLRETRRIREALDEFLALESTGVDSIELHFELAQTYQILGRLGEAIEKYNEVLTIDERTPKYHFRAGTAYYDKGDYDRGRQYFQEALRLEPKLHEAHFYIGLTHLKQNNYEEAVKRFQVAKDEDRKDVRYRYYLAFTFMKQEKYTQARELFRQLSAELKRFPHLRAQVPDVFYQQGLLYFRKGQWERAIMYFKEGLGKHEKRPEPWFKMAEALAELSRYERAVGFYKEALKRDPNYGDAWYKLATAYRSKDRPDLKGVQKACRKAIDLESGTCDCHLWLAYIYRERRKKKLATREFKTYLDGCADGLSKEEREALRRDYDTIRR